MMMKVVVVMLLKKMTTLTTQEEELERNREAEAERQRREVVDLSSFFIVFRSFFLFIANQLTHIINFNSHNFLDEPV